MKIELLYVPDCPNHAPTVQVLREVLVEFGLSHEIIEIEVTDQPEAMATGFLGSPTIRIDGNDVEPGIITDSGPFGLTCRMYLVNGKRQGVPGREWVRQAVLSAVTLQKSDDGE
jgi:hypothetical protein